VTRVYRYSRGSEPARDVMGIWVRPWMLQVILEYARNRSLTTHLVKVSIIVSKYLSADTVVFSGPTKSIDGVCHG
jgi:hypothetical protein